MADRDHRRRRPWRRPLLRLLSAAAPPLLRAVLRAIQSTLRVEFVRAEALRARWQDGEQAIVAFWHNRLLILPILAAGARMCILVSHSRDGELATRVLAGWDVATVRGSASRGAVAGFLRLLGAYRKGYSLAVVPDGPRGPRYVAKSGVIHLARATGSPIYPVSYAASRSRALRSWDRLIIPSPFARLVVEVGEPLHVPGGASEEDIDRYREELERRLNALTEAAETRVAA